MEYNREAIVQAVSRALAEIYFSEVCRDNQTAEDLLNTAQRMKALHEAILTARDLLGIMDKAVQIGYETPPDQTGVIVLPDISDAPDM